MKLLATCGLYFQCAGVLLATQAPPWRTFRADALGITFRHPATPGLRIEARAPTCTAADRAWSGGASDSLLVVTRTVASPEQIAANIAIVREGERWVAAGYQDSRAPVAALHVAGWDALVADSAQTVVYDMALRSPVSARQWRLVAMGPAADGCRPLLLALATGMAATWDSTTVAAVLATMRTRAP